MIEQVRHGEVIVIIDHERPVAKLVPVGTNSRLDTTSELPMLERKGIIRRGNGAPCELTLQPKPLHNASALLALLDERQRVR